MTQAAAQTQDNIDLDYDLMANAIRFLTLDAIKAANSGHSGMPMGMADIATVLYSKHLKFDPANPTWPDRDRFIVSNGHGSMLLYALGYLTGYEKMTIEEIKNFRQLHSKTPGHPEVDFECGIETTTGPLGQGISNSVGFALAERIMNARFGNDLVDHYTYVFTGDGCLMEGVSQEASSLAGHLSLSKLIVFYDDNNVTIDGTTDITFTEDVAKRYEALGWHVQKIDGHNHVQIDNAIDDAKASKKPSIICCKTKIGYGAPTKECQPAAHGAITGDDEIAGTRENLNWPHEPFHIPNDILEMWRSLSAKGHHSHHMWDARLRKDNQQSEFSQAISGDVKKIVADITQQTKAAIAKDKPGDATRKSSGKCLEPLIAAIPEMVGGSADLTGSNNTKVAASAVINTGKYDGNYINYGVREHGMAAIMNGMALHGGIIPYSGTFLQFSDFSRPAIRLAALMKQRVIHVMTHDSIGLGEDGPTHQPVEHYAALRAIPNLYFFRPCDGIETAESWELALGLQESPSVLALTRQGIPTVCDNRKDNMVAKGAYIIHDCECDNPDITIFASGSEVHLAIEAAEKIDAKVRVVSVPCFELLWQQPGDYIQSLVCNDSIKIAVEAGVRQGWDALIGGHNTFIGMNSFGDSAPSGDLFKHFGITTDAIVDAANKKLQK